MRTRKTTEPKKKDFFFIVSSVSISPLDRGNYIVNRHTHTEWDTKGYDL